MSPAIAESHVEEAMLGWLAELGYETAYGPDVEPEKPGAERDDFTEVVLARRLRAALGRINRGLPATALDDALRKVIVTDRISADDRHTVCRESSLLQVEEVPRA